ncbi:hypothetical protein [Paenibacillus wynnii]|uniref:Uncharacterized protein n=1 Tax=Paenibacillus wynnii TaxID=268407 RepID=A0A098MDZ3_9BACL|nr:hypothetical protein [Paenibacillus wynnii]KGE20789.1 hypothetical protein PWYN_01000 [Paenibacillus wynnii]
MIRVISEQQKAGPGRGDMGSAASALIVMHTLYIHAGSGSAISNPPLAPQTRAPPTFVNPLHKRTLYAAYTFPTVGLSNPCNRAE